MNKLLNAMEVNTNVAYTENGAVTNASSLEPVLDLFFVGPVAKKNPADAVKAFQNAYAADRELSLRCLQWIRDIRGGAGARKAFRDCFGWLMRHRAKDAIAIMDKIALIGRWDDMLIALDGSVKVRNHAIELIRNALVIEKNGLCAKWMPRKGEVAAKLRTALELSPKSYRKLIVSLSKTVEQQMCAGQWDKINFEHVPSVAASRYRDAFKLHSEARYTKYIEAVTKGEAKINASAIFPHDVLNQITYRRTLDELTNKSINAQWKALPDYVKDSKSVLVVADVSGSMDQPVQGNTTAMKVCISMALYFAERIKGPFHDHFITFSHQPTLQKLRGDDIVNRFNQIYGTGGYNTNLQAVFDLVLNSAVKNKVAQEDMPETIMILSDMEFDAACSEHGYRSRSISNLDAIRNKYASAGYKMPKLVFWNLCGRLGNSPATKHDRDVALVSGFSPAVVASIFECEDMMPVNVMLKAIMKDRYDLNLQ